MLNNILQHKMMAGLIMVVILGAAWYGLTATSAPPPILQTDNPAGSGNEELVATLLALRAVTLSGTIFTDPVFMSLQDFGVEIQPEPVGRPNPFLPLSPVARPTPQTTQSAQIFAPAVKK
jgi:hypothetical protein